MVNPKSWLMELLLYMCNELWFYWCEWFQMWVLDEWLYRRSMDHDWHGGLVSNMRLPLQPTAIPGEQLDLVATNNQTMGHAVTCGKWTRAGTRITSNDDSSRVSCSLIQRHPSAATVKPWHWATSVVLRSHWATDTAIHHLSLPIGNGDPNLSATHDNTPFIGPCFPVSATDLAAASFAVNLFISLCVTRCIYVRQLAHRDRTECLYLAHLCASCSKLWKLSLGTNHPKTVISTAIS